MATRLYGVFKLRIFLILLVMILNLVALTSKGQTTLPTVHFRVESEAGLAVAETCGDLWKTEGPRIISELVPAHVVLDTVTCLILDDASFNNNFAGRLPDWGVGVALPGGRLIAINYSRLPAVGRGAREVFLHEMVHAVLFQMTGKVWLPTWFHEGCAMHYSGEWRFSDTVSLVLDGRVPNLNHLQGSFPAPAGLADRAYRTSLLAINRLRHEYGENAVGEILLATQSTGAFSLAFAQVTGAGLGEFMDDFASAMNLRLGWAVMLTRWPTLFVIMSLVFATGAARKMIRTRRRLAEMVDEEMLVIPESELNIESELKSKPKSKPEPDGKHFPTSS